MKGRGSGKVASRGRGGVEPMCPGASLVAPWSRPLVGSYVSRSPTAVG